METVVSRFILDEKPYYFRSSWNSNEFILFVTDGDLVWHGSADASYIENHLKPRGMQTLEYMELIRAALTEQDVEQKRFSYWISSVGSTSDIELIWKVKITDSENLDNNDRTSVHLRGNLLLRRVNQDQSKVIRQILDYLIDKSIAVEKRNKDLHNTNVEIQLQRDIVFQQFETLISEKKNLEKELYLKFVLVLNEKKKKIRELREELRNLGSSVPNSKTTCNPLSESEGNDKEDFRVDNERKTLSFEPASIFDPLSTTTTATGSSPLTFNTTMDPTPSHELLSTEEIYSVKARVRKRHQSNKETNAKNETNYRNMASLGSEDRKIHALDSSDDSYNQSIRTRTQCALEKPTDISSRKSSSPSDHAMLATSNGRAQTKNSLAKLRSPSSTNPPALSVTNIEHPIRESSRMKTRASKGLDIPPSPAIITPSLGTGENNRILKRQKTFQENAGAEDLLQLMDI